jgi:hypothetical protein
MLCIARGHGHVNSVTVFRSFLNYCSPTHDVVVLVFEKRGGHRRHANDGMRFWISRSDRSMAT